MANRNSTRMTTSEPSLHHWRKDEESPRVYRHQDQDQSNQDHPGRDNDPAQSRGAARVCVVESAVRLHLLHDRGLPGVSAGHTQALTGCGTARG